MLAAIKNNPEIMQILLAAGADKDAQNDNGNTALMFAVFNNHKDKISILLNRRVDIDAIDNKGNIALMCR